MTSPSMKRSTPDQRRAEAALRAVNAISKHEDFAKACKKTSSRIHTCGLLPAMAFLDAKRDSGEGKQNGVVHDTLAKYLEAFAPKGGGEVVHRFCTAASAAQLRRAQTEALAYLDWLARFAEARAKREGTK